jgi:hypothetical protein
MARLLLTRHDFRGMIWMAEGCGTIVTTDTSVVIGSTTKITHGFVAMESMILVAWNSSDLSMFTPASAPLLEAIDRTTAAAKLITTTHSGNKSTSSSTTPRLAAETKGLIAVGTVGGVLFFIMLGFLLAGARRHHIARKRASVTATTVDREIVPGKAESDGSVIFEADDEASKPAEADPSNMRVELEGEWHGYEAAARTLHSFRVASSTD